MNRNANGRAGGHKQDVRELLLVSARPASFFPVESDSARSLCYRYFFLSISPLAGPQQFPFLFPLSTKQITEVLGSKMELRDQHLWSNNVNIDAKKILPPPAVRLALVALHANTGRLN